MSSLTSPRGRISTRRREFQQVVRDVRHAVFSVVRQRKRADGTFEGGSLGSGFFVSKDVLLTCCHVIDGIRAPHQDGDEYLLVNQLEGNTSVIRVPPATKGKELFQFPESDLALLKVAGAGNDCWTALDFGYVWEGRDIGVAGYPLPRLQVINGALAFNGLVFRVARGEVTGRYVANIQPDTLPNALVDLPVIEVNFLFVSGNSGGPIFDAASGQVVGLVHGFQSYKLGERVESANPTLKLPAGMSRDYIAAVSAVYSIGIKIDRVQKELLSLGVV